MDAREVFQGGVLDLVYVSIVLDSVDMVCLWLANASSRVLQSGMLVNDANNIPTIRCSSTLIVQPSTSEVSEACLSQSQSDAKQMSILHRSTCVVCGSKQMLLFVCIVQCLCLCLCFVVVSVVTRVPLSAMPIRNVWVWEEEFPLVASNFRFCIS